MKKSFHYIPQLDGIRAFAILSVLIFHLHADWLPGGFLGVDVFFVLSAFLITTITLQKPPSEFSFASFYNKRIKRIIPPLYFTIFGTSLASFLLLAKEDFEYLKESIELIVLFSANVFFARQGDYFGPKTMEMPLLHTWSLAIEEQFYFFWPLLLLFIFLKSPKPIRYFLFSIVIIASFFYGEWLLSSYETAQKAYYSSFARFGQMLLGAFAAFAIRDSTAFSDSKKLSATLAYSGLGILLCFFILYKNHWAYPGITAITPSVAALMLIVGAYNLPSSSIPILSNSFSTWIGRISYSLYLWHWPVLALFRYRNDEVDLPISQICFALILIVGLSSFSYYIVEQRTRHSGTNFKKTIWLYLVIPAISLSLANLILLESLRKMDHFSNGHLSKARCHDKMLESCAVGDLSQPTHILAFGDSHMGHLNAFLDVVGKHEGWSADVVSIGDCRPIFGVDEKVLQTNSRFHKCNDLHDWVRKNIHKYSRILVAGRWESYFEKDDLHADENFKNTISFLQEQNREVVLFAQVRRPSVNPRKSRALIKFTKSKEQPQVERIDKLVESLLPSSVRWIDLYKLSLEIPADSNTYYDAHHLTEKGAAELAEKFIESKNLLFHHNRD